LSNHTPWFHIFPPLNVIIKCVKNLFCALLAFEEGFLSTSNYVGMRHQMSLSASQDHRFI
uniref:Uncharacterized protein n=1 Tax=Seriola lalandi dorsalis TaxID=1841481 RepID=A0A3B4WQA7_SERLL